MNPEQSVARKITRICQMLNHVFVQNFWHFFQVKNFISRNRFSYHFLSRLSEHSKIITFIYNQSLYLNRELECVPDVWSLTEWCNWLTPISLPRRFDTLFYTCFLDEEPTVLLDDKEMSQAKVFLFS